MEKIVEYNQKYFQFAGVETLDQKGTLKSFDTNDLFCEHIWSQNKMKILKCEIMVTT